MSNKAITLVWERSAATGSTLLVALYLADVTNEDKGGTAWPSIATIAKMARISPRSAQYAINELARLGELEVRRGAGKHGTNVYRLKVEVLASRDGEGRNLCRGADSAGVQPAAERGAASCTQSLMGTLSEEREPAREAVSFDVEAGRFVVPPRILDGLLVRFGAETVEQAVRQAETYCLATGETPRNPGAFLLASLEKKAEHDSRPRLAVVGGTHSRKRRADALVTGLFADHYASRSGSDFIDVDVQEVRHA